MAVTADYLRRVAPTGTTVETVVEASFVFLLEREPRESILRTFDLSVIPRYFPEYEGQLVKRLAPDAP